MGYVSPFQRRGHDGPCHDMEFPLEERCSCGLTTLLIMIDPTGGHWHAGQEKGRTWKPPREPLGSGWTAEEWMCEVRALRVALHALGVLVSSCLPGEPEDCGEPLADHYVSYLALLNARVLAMAQGSLNEAQQVEFTHRVQEAYAQYDADAEDGGS